MADEEDPTRKHSITNAVSLLRARGAGHTEAW